MYVMEPEKNGPIGVQEERRFAGAYVILMPATWALQHPPGFPSTLMKSGIEALLRSRWTR
jgi:hypothetical protein